MKKYILMSFVAALTFSFTSCKEDDGTTPGNDDKPVATLYTYTVESPYNPDNDVAVRMVGNNKVENIYFLVEPTATHDANLKEKGESGYIEYVISNGSKGEIVEDAKKVLGSVTVEKVFTNLIGENIISAVAVSPSGKTLTTTSFVGLEWEDVKEGFYKFGDGSPLGEITGLEGMPTVLQHCATQGKTDLYRLSNVYGEGFHLKFNIMEDTKEETGDGGSLWFFRVAIQPTSWSYGEYGTIYVRDIAYWQGNDAFATYLGYGCILYDDGYAEFPLRYQVAAGGLAYTTAWTGDDAPGDCDIFIPNEL